MGEKLDNVIETLAFGQTAPKVTRCLGLFLSPDTIYISESHVEKDGKVVVDQLIRVPVPAVEASVEVKGEEGKVGPGAKTMGTGTLNTDFLTDNAKLSALIRQSMSQVRWNSKQVMVTLSHHLGLVRYFTMPAIDRPFWKSAIPVEAKKYIPIPFDALSYDYQVLPLPPDAANKPRQGALIAVTQKKNLSNIESLLTGLGLQLVGMEVAPCSVLRLWQGLEKLQPDQPYAQVHFDGGNVRVLISDKGIPVFFREIFLGGEATTADQRKIDLAGCLNFANKQLSIGKLAGVKVSGSGSQLAAWVDAFKTETGLPVSIQDTPAMLSIKGGDWGGFASVGASLRFLAAHKTMTLDLGAVGRVTEDERRVARDILGAGAIITALLVVVGLFRSMSYSMKAGELKKYKRDYEIEQVFQNKNAAEIENLLKMMRDQTDAAGAVGESGPKVTDILRDIIEALPEKVWLVTLEVRYPLQRTDRLRPSAYLSGHAVGATTQEEQDLAFRFRDAFAQSKSAKELFPDIQMSVARAPEQQGAPPEEDPDKFEEKREKRTEWKLSAGWKR